MARRRPYSREPGPGDDGLLRREREPGAVPDEGGAAEQRRRGQQREQVDGHRLHVLPHRRLPQRLLLGPLQDLRHLPGHLRPRTRAAVALIAAIPHQAGRVRHGAHALRLALRHGDGDLLHRALHDRLRQRRLPAQHRHLRGRPVRRGGPRRGALQGLLLQLLLPGAQPRLALLQHLPQLPPGPRQVGARLLGLHRRRRHRPAALPQRHAPVPPRAALRQPHGQHLPGRLRRLQELEVRRRVLLLRRGDPVRGRREDGRRLKEAPAHQRLQVLGPRGAHHRRHQLQARHLQQNARPVEAVHGDAGGASEEHPPDPPYLGLHHPLLRRLHPDGVALRRAGGRDAPNHASGRLLDPGLQHVGLRHPHRRDHHLSVPAGHLPVPRTVHRPLDRTHRAAEDGPWPGPRRNGHGHRRHGGALQEGQRDHREQQRAAHPMAGAAVRADRRVGGDDVRGPARVLQRRDARRVQELRQRAVHDVHVARQLLQRHHRECGHQGHRRGRAAGLDPGGPERGPPQQVLLPARHTLHRRLRGVPRLRRPLQEELQGGRAERRRGGRERGRRGGMPRVTRSAASLDGRLAAVVLEIGDLMHERWYVRFRTRDGSLVDDRTCMGSAVAGCCHD
ncbi:hypothetical protein ACQJBY_058512 [Aegilops geniculata]